MKKKSEIQLIATDYSPKILKNKNLFYLGSWCSSKKNEGKKFQEFVWSKKTILEKDYFYLEKLLKRLANSISCYLNEYHKTSYPVNFWKSLIWIWLCFYLSSNFFRWKTFASAIKKNKSKKIKFVQVDLGLSFCAKDTHSYKNFVQESDIFNEYIFSKISKYFSNNIKIIKIKKNLDKKLYKKFDYSLKEKINRFIKKVINFTKVKILRSSAIVFQGIDIKNLLYLNFTRFTLPIFINEFFPVKDIELKKLSESQITKRKEKKINFEVKNDFEKYLLESLSYDIPISFLENFEKFMSYAKNLNIKNNLIISSVGHYFNDRYKIWVFFKKIFEKNKFIVIEHGGNHSKSRHSTFFNYDNIVSDEFIPWSHSANLPAEKFIGFNLGKQEPKNLLYIGFETDKFPSKTINEITTLEDLENIPNLKYLNKKLNKKIIKKLVYVQKNDREKRIMLTLKKLIGENKTRKKGTFLKELKKTNLAICDYPQTTYFESILSCPTILVINYTENWTPLKKYYKLYQSLEKNNMLFKDIKSATKFINNNWGNIKEWWDSKKIKNLRKRLLNEFSIDTNKDGIKKWSRFIKEKYKE